MLSRFPVLVSPAPLAEDLAYSARAGQPLVSLISRSQVGRAGQPPYYPYLAFRLSRPLLVHAFPILSLHERTWIWDVLLYTGSAFAAVVAA